MSGTVTYGKLTPLAAGDVDPRFLLDFSLVLDAADTIAGTPTVASPAGGPGVGGVAIATGKAGTGKAVGFTLTAAAGIAAGTYTLIVTVDTARGCHLNRQVRVPVGSAP